MLDNIKFIIVMLFTAELIIWIGTIIKIIVNIHVGSDDVKKIIAYWDTPLRKQLIIATLITIGLLIIL